METVICERCGKAVTDLFEDSYLDGSGQGFDLVCASCLDDAIGILVRSLWLHADSPE